ncbi:MAG TPA: hypothetical protein VG605_12710 [Puia sp.]|nr:hypothetical protein [Puia sp.]
MKLPQLLSQFLYQTRKLDLPGIGSFTLDPAAVIPQESDRTGQMPATGIQFKNVSIFTPDDALISYIKEHTGKMKSLAAADLDFYLTTGRQLLNIGKPFYLEGIGTLIKNKEGKLDFTPGEYLIPRLDEPAGGERHRTPAADRTRNTYDEPPREEPKADNVRQRQTMLLLLLIAGVIVVGYGGYRLYERNNFVDQSAENRATVIPDTPATKSADTTTTTTAIAARTLTDTALAKKDTAKADATAATPPPTPAPIIRHDPVPTAGQYLYHFVILRTPNKGHALRRYNQLLGYQLNIRIETRDSSFFKLYFPIAALPQDTSHIKDSIADQYAANVVIEQQ